MLKCTLMSGPMSMFKVYPDVSPIKYVRLLMKLHMSKYSIIQVCKYLIIQVSVQVAHRQYITQKALELSIMLPSQVPQLSDLGILHTQ